MIPRRIYWLLDILVVLIGFQVAALTAPRILDVLAGAGVLESAPLLRAFSPADPRAILPFPPSEEFLWMLPLMMIATLSTMEALRGYDPPAKQSRSSIALRAFAAVIIGVGLVALIPFALRDPRWSRAFVAVFSVTTAVGLSSYRLILRDYKLRRVAAGYYAKHLALAGDPPAVSRVVQHLSRVLKPNDYVLEGYFDSRDAVALDSLQLDNIVVPCLGRVEDLRTIIVNRPVDELIAVQSDQPKPWLNDVMEACDYFRVTLRIVPVALLQGHFRDLSYAYRADAFALPEIVLKPIRLDADAQAVKRVIDVLVSAVLLVLLLPLFAVIALLIKITTPRLPVFYRWLVIGFQGRPFTGYKFTTMVADADARRAELTALNEMTGPVFKIRNDPRVTMVGRVLRKYSLNELPQLWSVLKGDMSLVGPRPAFAHELERYEMWHKRKLCVRPGITCLWQVRGRNRISNFDEWVRMDLEYIDSWSLWLDFKILFRTAWAVVSGNGS